MSAQTAPWRRDHIFSSPVAALGLLILFYRSIYIDFCLIVKEVSILFEYALIVSEVESVSYLKIDVSSKLSKKSFSSSRR